MDTDRRERDYDDSLMRSQR